jgi:hypothetical protein
MMHDEVSKQIMIEKSSVNRTVVGTVTITVNGEVETQVLKEPMLSSELRLML